MFTSDSVTMIALRATPSGRCRFWGVPASLVGTDAMHRCFPRSLPRPKINTVLATLSDVIML
jgi:hypothetical protein